MKKEVFAQFGHPGWILFAFLLFFFCFLGIIYWTFRKTNKDFYNRMALLPILKDEKKGII